MTDAAEASPSDISKAVVEAESEPTAESAAANLSSEPRKKGSADYGDDANAKKKKETTESGNKCIQWDFVVCIAMLAIFGIICAIGFVVLKIVMFADDDKGKLLMKMRNDSVYAQSNGYFGKQQ